VVLIRICKKNIDMMKNEVFRSSHIIEGLLDLARTQVPSLKEVSLGKVIDNILNHIVVPDDIKVIKKYDATSSTASIDEMQIERVFVNIMQNAIQEMQAGGTLTISVISDDGHMKIDFTDTGRGIPPENLEKIFNAMFTTKSDMGGTGVGLAICKTIVEAHNGSIEVKSTEGKGSTFAVKLPIGK
jgi:signal transduction histidine kinase